MTWAFPKPSRAVVALMAALLVIWVAVATSMNWADAAGAPLVEVLVGNSSNVLHGQIWRLLTAALIHQWTGGGAVFHILFTLLLLYFFLPPLEDRWGRRRLFLFLAGSAVFAYAIETLAFWAFPTVAAAHWLGGMVLVDAAIVAWALGAGDAVVRLYFVLPVRPMVLVGIMFAFNVLQLIARDNAPEGVFAPFAAMGAGFLFGGESSPLRRLYLKWKLKRLQAEVSALTKQRKRPSHLRVIPGGNPGDDDDKMVH
jgi:membrane associated rhomboid family serine protease